MLVQNGTRILKFFLHISPEGQLARFKQRLNVNIDIRRPSFPGILHKLNSASQKSSGKPLKNLSVFTTGAVWLRP